MYRAKARGRGVTRSASTARWRTSVLSGRDRLGARERDDPRRQGRRGRDPGRPGDPGGPTARARRRAGAGDAARRRRPGQPFVRRRQAPRLRTGRHHLAAARAAAPTPPRRRSRPSSTSSTPTRRAPATSSSCRCPAAWTPAPRCTRMDPAKDADGLHPTNLGRLVLGEPGPLPCTPAGHRAAAPAVRRRARRGRRRGRRSRRHRRAAAGPAADPAYRERHRDALPHRHPRPGRRTCAAPTSSSPPPACPVWSRPTWCGRARRSSTSASPGPRAAAWWATCAEDVREVAGHLAPMPGGVGPMTRAMLLLNVVESAEQSLADRTAAAGA